MSRPEIGEELKMLKKILIGTAVAAGGAGLLMGTSAISYMRMGVASVQEGIRDSIPIEVEIKRAREMIQDLKPEIASNLRVIAREEVEVARLSTEVESKHKGLAKARKDILRLKDDLQTGDSHFVYAKRSYTADEVKEDLSGRFKQFQTQEQTVAKMEKILEARQKNLDAARQKLDSMLAAKRQLEVEVENLQARLTMVEVAETSSQIAINDSQLSQTVSCWTISAAGSMLLRSLSTAKGSSTVASTWKKKYQPTWSTRSPITLVKAESKSKTWSASKALHE